MLMESEVFILRPDWKYNFLPYMFSILLFPVGGVGIIMFSYYVRRLSSREYRITNDAIEISGPEGKKRISISDITSIDLTRSAAERWFELGTLHLHTKTEEVTLLGLLSPIGVKEALEAAILQEEKRQEIKMKSNGDYSNINIGGLQSMDELVGLWQQGLISEEDFKRERRKFEQ